MSQGAPVELVVGAAAGEVVLITAAIGWLLRRTVARYDKMADQVQRLVTHMRISETTGPETQRRLGEVEEETADLTTRVAIIGDRLGQHERWHERHDHPRPAAEPG